ncbi:MAG: flagellar hook basal-body protein [Polyangiaceae bacterium]|nr:flagellar hook basal-body protein [Polyangiaceae bacterium]
MAKGVYAALSGAVAAETALDTVAQNLANGSSEGYRRLRPVFREALANAEPEQRPGSNRFALVASTAIDTTPGVIKSTGRDLDAVLPEGAFFAVSTPQGERYTRAGSIQIDATGAMQVGGGQLVDDGGEPLRAPENAAISLTPDGQVMADGQSIGRLRIVKFETPSALVPEGKSLYAASAQSGTAAVAEGELTIGAVEESNASTVDSMTDMIKSTRLFDSYQRAIDAFFDLDRRITSSMNG